MVASCGSTGAEPLGEAAFLRDESVWSHSWVTHGSMWDAEVSSEPEAFKTHAFGMDLLIPLQMEQEIHAW